MAAKLLTKEILKKLPALYANDGKGEEALAVVKFFTPDSSWSWFASEYDPAEGLFFGLADNGRDNAELGYFSLADLQTTRAGSLRLPIERDLYFTPKPLHACRRPERAPVAKVAGFDD